MIEPLPDLLIEPIVRAALAEDLGRAGDITTAACMPAAAQADRPLVFAARKPGVVAGLDCARLAIAALDPRRALRGRCSPTAPASSRATDRAGRGQRPALLVGRARGA